MRGEKVIDNMILLREKCQKYIEQAFNNDNGFSTAMKWALEALFTK